MGTEFQKIYIAFLKEVRLFVKEDFYFQNTPNLRIQTPSVNAFKFYPLYHSDIFFGHPPCELNIWIPLNEPSKEGYGFAIAPLENSINEFKRHDYNIDKIKNDKSLNKRFNNISSIQNFDFGNYILFDCRKIHSTIPLIDHSRVSLDIRVVPCSILNKMTTEYVSMGRRKVKYIPSEGYNSKSIDNI